LLKDGNVLVGVFPEREEIGVGGASFCTVPLHGVSAGEAQFAERRVLTFVHIPGTMIKVHANNGASSVASLKGTYAFSRTGVNNAMGGPVAQMGLDVINRDGTRGIIRSTGSSNDGNYDWTDAPWPSGSYTVDPDCTGSFFEADGTKSQNVIVLVRHSASYFLFANPGSRRTRDASVAAMSARTRGPFAAVGLRLLEA
jgi:hypothetical protein